LEQSLVVDVWAHLPDDIFWNHILPQCDIDTRMQFKARAPRVTLPPLEPGFAMEMDRYLTWRRDRQCVLPELGACYVYKVPCWKYGAWVTRTWRGCAAHELTPKVCFRICNSYFENEYKPEGSLWLSVYRVDTRSMVDPDTISKKARETLIAKVWV
jgi:hypothetical protein